jgi:hypothetical protein
MLEQHLNALPLSPETSLWEQFSDVFLIWKRSLAVPSRGWVASTRWQYDVRHGTHDARSAYELHRRSNFGEHTVRQEGTAQLQGNIFSLVGV